MNEFNADMFENFLKILNAKKQNSSTFPRFICDSREISKGDVFVALKGENTDGHNFVDAAFQNGAILAIVCHGYEKKENTFACNDPLSFIQNYALWNLKRVNPQIIGITGSCGKTSAKRFLKTLLETEYGVFATFGNYNSQIGIPLSLCSLETHHKFAVIEMGMSFAGDIHKLVSWIKPHFAIITSIGLAHAENFVDKDLGIARAKGEILSFNPKAYYNQKTNTYEPFNSYQNRKILSTDGIFEEDGHLYFMINDQKMGPFTTSIDAQVLLENLHLVLTCALDLGLSLENAKKGVKNLTLEHQRLSIRSFLNIEFIDDSYNASPSSMISAINYLKSRNSNRKIAVIGAMKELGESSYEAHMSLKTHLESDIDFTYFIGEETETVSRSMPGKSAYVSSIEELKSKLENDLKEGDCVLVKGSHSTKLHTLCDLLANSLA